jgi:hypothetical protein
VAVLTARDRRPRDGVSERAATGLTRPEEIPMKKMILSLMFLLAFVVAAHAGGASQYTGVAAPLAIPVALASTPTGLELCGQWCISNYDCPPPGGACSDCVHGQCDMLYMPAAPTGEW